MATFVEYELGDGQSILIQAPDDIQDDERIPATGSDILKPIQSRIPLSEAFEQAKLQTKILIEQLNDMPIREAEIKFGLTTVGEIGMMAIGKLGVEVNYEVTIKWKRPESET